jgi:hypothetical protein
MRQPLTPAKACKGDLLPTRPVLISVVTGQSGGRTAPPSACWAGGKRGTFLTDSLTGEALSVPVLSCDGHEGSQEPHPGSSPWATPSPKSRATALTQVSGHFLESGQQSSEVTKQLTRAGTKQMVWSDFREERVSRDVLEACPSLGC